jgi:hypothetical protein
MLREEGRSAVSGKSPIDLLDALEAAFRAAPGRDLKARTRVVSICKKLTVYPDPAVRLGVSRVKEAAHLWFSVKNWMRINPDPARARRTVGADLADLRAALQRVLESEG